MLSGKNTKVAEESKSTFVPRRAQFSEPRTKTGGMRHEQRKVGLTSRGCGFHPQSHRRKYSGFLNPNHHLIPGSRNRWWEGDRGLSSHRTVPRSSRKSNSRACSAHWVLLRHLAASGCSGGWEIGLHADTLPLQRVGVCYYRRAAWMPRTSSLPPNKQSLLTS